MLFRHILVPYDGSAPSKAALAQAIRFIDATSGTKLTVMHVMTLPKGFNVAGEIMFAPLNYNPEDELKRGKQLLDEAEAVAIGVPRLQTVQQFGDPGTVILEQAEALGCDLIIMGSRGRGKLKELVLGSVSHHAAQHARVPVLIVK